LEVFVSVSSIVNNFVDLGLRGVLKGMEERRRLGGEVVEVDDGLELSVRGSGGGGGGGGELVILPPVSTTSSWAQGGGGERGEALGAVVVWEREARERVDMG
jgi:hypothetical protein